MLFSMILAAWLFFRIIRRLILYERYYLDRQAMRRAQTEKARAAAEKARAQAEKQMQREIEAHKKQLANLERERKRAINAENKRLQAQTLIDHYEPDRQYQIAKIRRLENELQIAEQTGHGNADLDKRREIIRREREKLYQIERKLEKAQFVSESG